LNLLKNSKPLLTREKHRLEIDIMIANVPVGFEIQDFATHSEYSNTEMPDKVWVDRAIRSGVKPYKKGPAYHGLKRELARIQLGVVLIDIWQDEIKDGSFENKIIKAYSQ
jgi:hypothetical protein